MKEEKEEKRWQTLIKLRFDCALIKAKKKSVADSCFSLRNAQRNKEIIVNYRRLQFSYEKEMHLLLMQFENHCSIRRVEKGARMRKMRNHDRLGTYENHHHEINRSFHTVQPFFVSSNYKRKKE